MASNLSELCLPMFFFQYISNLQKFNSSKSSINLFVKILPLQRFCSIWYVIISANKSHVLSPIMAKVTKLCSREKFNELLNFEDKPQFLH